MKKKTSRGESNISDYRNAYEEIKKGKSIRAAETQFGLCHVSLMRYKRKREVASSDTNGESVRMGYIAHNRVFNDDQEQELAKYLMRCADIYFGLSNKGVRKLAYE